MQGKVDILVISETKLDESFPLNQFTLEGFHPLSERIGTPRVGVTGLHKRGYSLQGKKI